MWETLWPELEFSKTKNLIGLVYHNNGIVDIPFFSQTLEKNKKKHTSARNKNTKFYIVGEFNANVLKIHTFHNISALIDMMYTYSAVMLVNKPTRFPIGNQRGDPSLLDHFIKYKKFGMITKQYFTGSFFLLAIIENTSPKRIEKIPDIFIRDYKKVDINALRELSLFDPSYLNGLSIYNKFQLFQQHIRKTALKHMSPSENYPFEKKI